MTTFTYAQDDLDLDPKCLSPGASSFQLPQEFEQLLNVTAQERRDFMRRTMFPSGGWPLALSIETNFKVPFIGNQNYFGKIFFKKGENFIRYRDEIIASDHYRDEGANPNFYNTNRFGIARMNSAGGSQVATGVKLIGRNFNSNTGGHLTIQVDPPGSGPVNIPMDVAVVNGRTVLSLKVYGRPVEFNSLKINAKGGSLLRGVETVQFFKNGRLVHTLTN
jgi:hypothetical protein